MGYEGLRPKLNTLKYNPRSADPVNPAEGEVQYADGTVRAEGLWVYKNSAWTPVGSGSGSALNYILDDSSTFEGSIGSWVTYVDAAGSSPVDGTGGSANITFARSTSSPLNGTADGLLTKDAADRQGEGISCDFSIDNAYKNRPLKIKFNYAASANFVNGSVDGVTPSDIQVFMYDVTNAALVSVFPNTLDGSGQFLGQLQASDSTSYRLILHIRSTNALAYTMQVDNFEVSPVDDAFIQSDSDWISYTPATAQQGFGNISSVNYKYRKNGPDAELMITWTSGTVTASEARMELPTGLVSASDYPSGTALAGMFVGNGQGTHISVLIEPSTAYLTFGTGTGGTNGYSKRAGNVVSTTGSINTLFARVRIQGWTSGYATPAVSAQNVPAVFSAYKNGGAVTADTTIPSWTALNKDSTGIFNLTTGEATIKQAGDYYGTFVFNQTTNTSNVPDIYVNGVLKLRGNNATAALKSVSGILWNLQVGDVVTARTDGTLTTASNTNTTFSLFKIETPAASMNIRKVAILSDVKADATDAGTFTSGAWQTRTLNTESDPFGIVALTANQFVVQPGTYVIEGSAPAFGVNGHQTRLRNITAGTTTKVGTREYAVATSDQTRSTFYTVVSVTVATTFELQHRCGTTRATDGFGRSNVDSFGEQIEYAQVKIEKLL